MIECNEYHSMMTQNIGSTELRHCAAKSIKNGLGIVGGTTTKPSEFPHMVQ